MFTRSDAEKYFFGEKNESLLFIIIGGLAIAAALVFYFWFKTSAYKGAAIPLVIFGLIQMIVGSTVYQRSDKQRVDIVYKMNMNTPAIQQQEVPRMQKVMSNFGMYKWVEIALAILGCVLFYVYRSNPDQLFLKGLGITLALQALLMLCLDLAAEKRGQKYLEGIISLQHGSPQSISPA